MANQNSVQLCLVMDCTASMGEWIEAAKTRLISSLTTIKQTFPTHDIRVAFVGYRDVNDEERFIVHRFTSNHDSVLQTIRNVKPMGGDDIAEDVGGAYNIVTTLGWTADVRVVFHVCDAPNHGLEYHSPYLNDDFPEGIGGIKLSEHVQTLATKCVDVNFLRITEITDIMTERMRAAYTAIRPTGFLVMNVAGQLRLEGTDSEDEDIEIRRDGDCPPSLLGRHSSSVIFEDMLVRATSSAITQNPGQP